MWKVAGQSLVGTSHLKGGIPCQDYCSHRTVTNAAGTKRCVIAVADGAGSAREAEIGAKMTVDLVLDEVGAFEGKIDEIDLALAVSWLQEALRKLTERAAENGHRVADYSATLLLAVLDEQSGFFLQLGDGAWVVKTPSGIESATWPEDGEYVNETTFLTSTRFAEHVSVALIEMPIYVAGFTDGMQRLFLDFKRNGPHKPMARKIFSALANSPDDGAVGVLVKDFLESELVNDQVDDDKTLVLAWRDATGAAVAE